MKNTYVVPKAEVVRFTTEDIMQASQTGNFFGWDFNWDLDWENNGEGNTDDPKWEGFN